MRFNYIDYTKAGSANLKRNPQRSGKFVQLMAREEEYIVLESQNVCPYHANIVEKFLLTRGVSGRYNAKRDNFTPSNSEWEILGGGKWHIDEHETTLELWGESLAYGSFHPAGLADNIEAILPGYKVVVR